MVEGVSGKTEKKASFKLIKVPSLRSVEDVFLACILTLTEKKFIIGVQEG